MTVVINGTTGISGVAGSATTPALIGTDVDSGFYVNSANEPNASVNGTAVWSAASSFGFKNRIINGAMVIDQRNAGASVNNTTSNLYVMDRWFMYGSVSSKFSIQQNAGSVTPPAGFKNYCGVTSLSAFTPSTSQLDYFGQYIEGYNIADLAWGTANASAITVSFWVRSSLTGAFSGCVSNGTDRSYPFTYTINSANTWEYKTVTVAGDTSGTWGSTNGVGIVLRFNLGSGSDWLGTANTWSASNLIGASTGTTSLVGTNGATLYITGVQLEKGSTATSFDVRPYGSELALCQRYYETGAIAFANQSVISGTYKVSKRASPTMTRLGSIYSGAEAGTFLSFGGFPQDAYYVTSGSTYIGGYWSAAAEL